MGVAGTAGAQAPVTNPTAPAVATPATATAALPPGYLALLTDFQGVEQRMRTDIQHGQANTWVAFLKPGLAEGNSLYWWLLARWHADQGHQDLAYKTAVEAVVYTRTELALCNKPNAEQSTRLLAQHGDIVQRGASSQAKRESILNSLSQLEQRIQMEQPLRGMACDLDRIQRQQADQARLAGGRNGAGKSATVLLSDFRAGSPKEIEQRVSMMAFALTQLKAEFQYDQVRKNASADELFRSRRQGP